VVEAPWDITIKYLQGPVYTSLPRDAMLARYILWPCVFPSVRVSLPSRYCTKTAKRMITESTAYDSPGTLYSDANAIFFLFDV